MKAKRQTSAGRARRKGLKAVGLTQQVVAAG
jgi:hypothetical protein